MAADTLFAHVVPMYTNQTERAATEALGYILSESEAARRGVEELVAGGGVTCGQIAQVRTEVRGADGTRVDLVGFDAKGAERLLVEVKFWAELTEKQPNAYLGRLLPPGPAVLLFVVPGTRVEYLWPEVHRLADEKYKPLVPAQQDGRLRSARLADGHGLMMTSWRGLLDSMAAVARSAADEKAEAEIDQLSGLTNMMDMEAFLPLSSDDLKPSIPRRIMGLSRLMDAVVTRLDAAGWAQRVRRSTDASGGPGCWLEFNGSHVWFGLSWAQWGRHGGSPLWLWTQSPEARATLLAHCESPDGENFRVDLPTDAEYDIVLNAVLAQLEQLGKVFGRDDQPY